MDQSRSIKGSADDSIEECLASLQIFFLCDWDVLIFVYRHRASLSNADQMARLLGYSSKAVGAALERLESQGLILRSRNSGGARFYQLAAGEAPAADESCLGRLMSVAETRPGRLMLMKLMGRNDERHIAGNERSK